MRVRDGGGGLDVEIINGSFSNNNLLGKLASIDLEGVNAVTIRGEVTVNENTQDGLRVDGGGDITVTGASFTNNFVFALVLENVGAVTINDVTAKGNAGGMLVNDTGGKNVVVKGSRFLTDRALFFAIPGLDLTPGRGGRQVGMVVIEDTVVSGRTGNGIRIRSAGVARLTRVAAGNSRKDGVNISNVRAVRIRDVAATNNKGDGLELSRNGAVTISGSFINNDGCGIKLNRNRSVRILPFKTTTSPNGEGVVCNVGSLTSASTATTAIDEVLHADQEYSLLGEAIAQWQRAGFDPTSLSNIEIAIVDLPLRELARFEGGVITFDVNAAGAGWFVDPTPGEYSEFSIALDEGSHLATNVSAAAGRYDLLTTAVHEVGHALGFVHTHDGVMAETLAVGERRLPGEEHNHGEETLVVPMFDSNSQENSTSDESFESAVIFSPQLLAEKSNYALENDFDTPLTDDDFDSSEPVPYLPEEDLDADSFFSEFEDSLLDDMLAIL